MSLPLVNPSRLSVTTRPSIQVGAGRHQHEPVEVELFTEVETRRVPPLIRDDADRATEPGLPDRLMQRRYAARRLDCDTPLR